MFLFFLILVGALVMSSTPIKPAETPNQNSTGFVDPIQHAKAHATAFFWEMYGASPRQN